MTLLAAKILLAPLCVVAVSLAGRRWGVAVAGVLGGLPVVAGPVLLVETLLHGTDFGADAAAGTLLGLAALTAFVVVYGRVAVTAGPFPTVLCGWTAFLLGVAVLSPVQPPPALSLVFVAACFALGLRLLPPASSLPPTAAAPPWWDLPARALAALGLVLALTAVSGALGPHLSGLLAPFPIITSVLAVFTHAHGGVARVGVLLRNFLVGFYGFAAFCFTLAVTLPTLTTAAAFGLATAAALAVQGTIFILRSRVSSVDTLPENHPTRRSQSANTRRYDRIARLYSTLEPLYLIFPPARRKAVAALGLKPGDTVLEIGAGTGRNFQYLVEAVGPTGTVIGVDASAGMLAEARKLIERRGWSNVQLLQQDATRLKVDRDVDGVLFSLSYSAMPEPRPALARAWEQLRPSSRVVVMDMGLTQGGPYRLLAPIARLLVKYAPGDAYSDPWSDLAGYGAVETERFLLGFFYVSAVVKGQDAPSTT